MTMAEGLSPSALVDGELRVVAVNGAATRLTGVPKDALLGTCLDDWINLSPALRERLRHGLRAPSGTWCETIPLRLTRQGTGSAVVRLKPVPVREGHLMISLIAVLLSGEGRSGSTGWQLSTVPGYLQNLEPKGGSREREAVPRLR